MGCALTMRNTKNDEACFVCGPGIVACRCGVVAVALCDYPIDSATTCDQLLCDICRVRQGGELLDLDFCPTHALIAQGRATPPSPQQLVLWSQPVTAP